MPDSLRSADTKIRQHKSTVVANCQIVQFLVTSDVHASVAGNRDDRGTGGQTYGPSSGFALEPGFVPNAINDASEASPELSAGQHYRLRIRWEFGVEN